MTPVEPNDQTMDRAREDHRAADEARAEKRADDWRAQATGIEDGMADAVERAAATSPGRARDPCLGTVRRRGAEESALPDGTGLA